MFVLAPHSNRLSYRVFHANPFKEWLIYSNVALVGYFA